jgi:hypothetical protein
LFTAVHWPDGEGFENGAKVDQGVLLTATIGPVAAATKATITWSNAGLHLHSKTIAFAMEYIDGGVAAAARK